jgi:hypothetical protein
MRQYSAARTNDTRKLITKISSLTQQQQAPKNTLLINPKPKQRHKQNQQIIFCRLLCRPHKYKQTQKHKQQHTK